ncbi:MAG: TetR/AcrR family transcriptional regulator [Chloroflexota bacterium]
MTSTPYTRPPRPARGRPLGFDENQAIDALMRTFWELGWRGASVSILEERTGVARSSLVNTFGSKHEMYLAALHLYAELVDELLLDPMASGVAGSDDVLRFFERLRHSKASEPGSWGCLMAVSMTELPTDPDIVAATRAYRERLVAALEAALRRAEAEGQIRGGSSGTLAAGLAAAVIGINVATRAGASSDELDTLISGVNELRLRHSTHAPESMTVRIRQGVVSDSR